MSIYSICYVSESLLDDLVLDTRAEMDKILERSRIRNAAAGVTGALLFNERLFAQVLEGPSPEVETTFARIRRDARHKVVTVLATGSFDHRRFSDWTMAYAGNSERARMYYTDYVSGRLNWRAMTNDAIGQMMLKMISLENFG